MAIRVERAKRHNASPLNCDLMRGNGAAAATVEGSSLAFIRSSERRRAVHNLTCIADQRTVQHAMNGVQRLRQEEQAGGNVEVGNVRKARL